MVLDGGGGAHPCGRVRLAPPLAGGALGLVQDAIRAGRLQHVAFDLFGKTQVACCARVSGRVAESGRVAWC